MDLSQFGEIKPWDSIAGCCGDCIGYPVRGVSYEFSEAEVLLLNKAAHVLAYARELEAALDAARAEVESLRGLVEGAYVEGWNDSASDGYPHSGIVGWFALSDTKAALDAGKGARP